MSGDKVVCLAVYTTMIRKLNTPWLSYLKHTQTYPQVLSVTLAQSFTAL